MSEIIFTNVKKWKIKKEYFPSVAYNNIPEWYKKISPYIDLNDKKQVTNSTVKKCIPFFDAMTSGYLIYLPSRLYVYRMNDGTPVFEPEDVELKLNLIDYHTSSQVGQYIEKENTVIPKILNPWSIKTDPGYSCFILNPLHRKSPISIMEGIVDTDTSTSNINFPFTIPEDFEGNIEEGTPIAQIIPFKREKYVMKIGDEKEIEEAMTCAREVVNIEKINVYKDLFWSRKEYK